MVAQRIVIVVLLACAGFTAWTLRTRAMDQYLATQRYEDLYYLPPPQWLPLMSLGHREALADLIWMRSLVYFGDEFRHEGSVRHVFQYGRSLLTLDPDFRRVYKWVGMAGLYSPKGSSLQMMEESIEVLEEGANRFPDDGSLAWDAGASIAYELMPHLPEDDPRIPAFRERANDYMMTAARLGAGPDWLVLTNVTQLKKLGKVERAVRHLEEMYAIVRDENVKRQIGAQLQLLRSTAYAAAFQQAVEEFEARRQRDYPYLTPTLYLFVADPVPATEVVDPDAELEVTEAAEG